MTYRRLHVEALWHAPQMRALRRKSEDAHALLQYLRTCPGGNYIGLFQLLEAHALVDLHWARLRYRKALKVLVKSGLIGYDAAAEVVYIPQVLEDDPISTKEQAIGAVRRLTALPATLLVERFKQDLLTRGIVELGEKVRPLLSHLGLTGVLPLSDTPSDIRQTPTPSQSHSPSQSHTQPVTYVAEPTDFQLGGRHGNGDGTRDGVPLTRAERFFEEQILPLTGESTFRDDWIRALSDPDAINIAQAALLIVSKRTGAEKPGAMLWSQFKKLRGERTAGVA